MKSQNPSTNAQNMPRSILRPHIPEESGKNEPPLAEIRQRAFEIHIERGGIHGCDLDDWLQAERELRERYSKNSVQ
jgi:Protein of unknown function (DUF2934)